MITSPSNHRIASFAILGGTLIMAACGGGDDAAQPVVDPAPVATSDVAVATTAPTPASSPAATVAVAVSGEKPVVEIPAVLPVELVVTEITAGSGPAAAVGDTVTVNYVGVRSEDGFEFDNNYDSGQPFSVVVGTGSVIPGFDQGLLGAQTGMRRQVDIPSALAYGDQDLGDIRPGDALTFVIDILSVEPRPVITAPPRADPADCPATDGSEPQQRVFDAPQPFCIDVTKTYAAEVVTNFGSITIQFDADQAPQAVNNFVTLARYKYFDDTQCHRVLTDFVVQCGDPQADGFGGPGYAIPDELPLPGQYELGSIAMANSGPDSAGSQFFIISGARGAGLPPQYTLFGAVVEGFDPVVTELNTLENPAGDNGTPPLEQILIESVTITES